MGGHHRADARPACLGNLLWEENEATTGDVVLICTLGLSCCMPRATSPLRWSTSPTFRPAFRSAGDFAGAARIARPPRGDAADPPWRQREIGIMSISLRRWAAYFPRLQFEFHAGRACRSGGPFRRRQVDPVRAPAALLRRPGRPHPDRRQGHCGVTQESLRESIGIVPQDISLFHRSVMDNIRYGRPDATEEKFWTPRPPRAAIHRDLAGRHAHAGRRPRRASSPAASASASPLRGRF